VFVQLVWQFLGSSPGKFLGFVFSPAAIFWLARDWFTLPKPCPIKHTGSNLEVLDARDAIRHARVAIVLGIVSAVGTLALYIYCWYLVTVANPGKDTKEVVVPAVAAPYVQWLLPAAAVTLLGVVIAKFLTRRARAA